MYRLYNNKMHILDFANTPYFIFLYLFISCVAFFLFGLTACLSCLFFSISFLFPNFLLFYFYFIILVSLLLILLFHETKTVLNNLNNCITRACFFWFHNEISVLWSNRTDKRSISRVVQQVWKYSDINFYQASSNTHGNILTFC